MPLPKVVIVGSVSQKVVVPVKTSSGATDAEKLVALNDNGVVDDTMVSGTSVKQHETIIDLDGGTY